MCNKQADMQVRAMVARVKGDMRAMATAIEAYYIDARDNYPCWAKGEKGANRLAGEQAGAYHIHTFRVWSNEAEAKSFWTLTTPVAYLSSYLEDPFADTKEVTFGYYADAKGWILYSWGPDRDENRRDNWDIEPDVEVIYRSEISQPSNTLIAGTSSAPAHEAYTYDPTNGTVSPGDIWRIK